MSVNKKIFFHVLLVSVFTYHLFWISLGAYFSFPNAEDLSVAVLARDKGIFPGAIHLLQTFDGRYTVNILHGLNPLAFDAYYANRLVAIFTILISWLSVFHLLNIRFKSKNKSENLLYALGFTTLFFSTLDLSQSLYWMICSFVYIYPLILFLNFYTFFLRYKEKHKNSDYALSILFLFLAIGCCELYIPLVGIFLIGLLFQHKANIIIRKIIFWYIVIFIASSLLFVTSPGIIYRFNKFDDGRSSDVFELIPIAFTHIISIFKALNYISLILFFILFSLDYNIKKNDQSKSFFLLISLTISICLLLLIFFLLGEAVFPVRTLPIFIALFTFVLIKVSPSFSGFYKPKKGLIIVVLTLTSTLLPNAYNNIKEDYQSGKLLVFKKEMDNQYSLLTNTEHQQKDCVKIIKLTNIENFLPNSIATMPYIKPNREDDFWNRAYEAYFKIDEVRLNKDTCQTIMSRTYEILY